MNTKRQTIWLVSMLSLMVVLSAYYLFTQDLDDADKLSGNSGVTENVSEVTGNGQGIVVDEVSQGESGISAGDKEVLEQLEQQGVVATGVFGQLWDKRVAMYSQEQDRLYAIISDVEGTDEEKTAATMAMEQLEDKNSKITELETALMDQYEMALISPEHDRYKVVVTSEKLEKKDAANIIEQVMKTLEVKPDQVSVQYVPAP